jgi:hypothetical protein
MPWKRTSGVAAVYDELAVLTTTLGDAADVAVWAVGNPDWINTALSD